jgi:predicted Zn-dependent protease
LGDLFNEMGDGVYIEGLERSDKDLTRDGKLRVLAYGWRVSRGVPVEPLGQIPIVVNPAEIMKEITRVGNDLDFWGRYGSPSVFIEKMSLRDV